MRSPRFVWLGLACALFVVPACGNGGGGGGGDDGDDDDTIDANPDDQPDADNTGFVELIGRDWTIEPGEQYKCIRVQVPETMYISSFRAQAPTGTHHTVLTFTGGGAVGPYDCDVASLGDFQMLYASGVSTDDLAFPEGVAIKVNAGDYINLNLHLFNIQPSGDLSGHSAILVKTIPANEVVHEAEMVFAGTGDFGNEGIPAHSTNHEESGGCTFDQSATLLAYWPHMHQFGVHQTVELTVGGNTTNLHDADYSFLEQRNYALAEPIQISSGDSIDVHCFYDNDTNSQIDWGDSSNAEMCFTGLYRYPKQALYLFECTNPPPGF